MFVQESGSFRCVSVPYGPQVPIDPPPYDPDPGDPNDDWDGDGLTNGEEVTVYLTDPRDADSDDDRYNDYEESVLVGSDPHDRYSP